VTDLLDRQLLCVVGKGGVGKTTVSAALALAAARRGKNVLVAMCNTRERLSQLLETQPIGAQNQPVLPRIDAVNMVPQIALQEYGHMVLRVKRLYSALFENRLVAAFLRGVPGLEAWAMLGKAVFHATHRDDGKRYDLVILDAPATGHALDMLRVPLVLSDVAPPGLLRREADNALALLRNQARSGAVLVTLPEDMPVTETFELAAALRTELAIPVSRLVVNSVLPRMFDDGEAKLALDLAERVGADSAIRSLTLAAKARVSRERVQRESIQRLDALDAPRTDLPHLFAPEFRRAQVESLSRTFG
jgi:anion-transporting  ArsA/GET3 family ATPase